MSVCVFPDCCWSVSGGAQPCPAQLTVVILPAPAPARPAWLSPTGELSLSLFHYSSSQTGPRALLCLTHTGYR